MPPVPRLTDRQRRALTSGKTVQWAADAYQVPRPRLIAAIAAEGWTVDPTTDRVRDHTNTPAAYRKATPMPENPDPAVPVPSPAEDTAGGIEQLLTDARASGDKRIERAAAKVDTAVEALRGLYVPWLAAQKEAAEKAARLAKAEERAARLRAELEQAQAEVASLRGKPARKTSSGPSRSKQIREWAAEHGIKVNPRGLIPRHVVEQYDAAHQEAPDGP